MIESDCVNFAKSQGVLAVCQQSNHEGVLIDAVHAAKDNHQGIVLNAGAYTHTSIALMDALASVDLPCVEVHLSNIHAREDFRHVSYISKVAVGQICGLGPQGYTMAISALISLLEESG